MVAYVNDDNGNTTKINALSINVEGVIRICEKMPGVFEISVPSLKRATELVEMNFRINQHTKVATVK